jgi:hypothetical protein
MLQGEYKTANMSRPSARGGEGFWFSLVQVSLFFVIYSVVFLRRRLSPNVRILFYTARVFLFTGLWDCLVGDFLGRDFP